MFCPAAVSVSFVENNRLSNSGLEQQMALQEQAKCDPYYLSPLKQKLKEPTGRNVIYE